MDHEHMRRLHSGKGASFEKLTYQIALISKALIANDTWLFRFEKPEGFIYRAGQHARMSLLSPKRKELDGTFRFWSFASAPFETDLAFAVRMRPSAFKAELADLPVGMRVQIDVLKNVPHGAFALDDALTPIVFLAGGIGKHRLNPVRSAQNRGPLPLGTFNVAQSWMTRALHVLGPYGPA